MVPRLPIYFIIWWLTLFAILPIGVRTQQENDDVVPGSSESAPAGFRLVPKLLLTTAVSAFVFMLYYVVTVFFGLSVDSLPLIVPTFE